MANKSTEEIIEFTPPVTTPGAPEKFEFRVVLLPKSQHIGQWSAIYSIIVR